jgi:hypothetical protein
MNLRTVTPPSIKQAPVALAVQQACRSWPSRDIGLQEARRPVSRTASASPCYSARRSWAGARWAATPGRSPVLGLRRRTPGSRITNLHAPSPQRPRVDVSAAPQPAHASGDIARGGPDQRTLTCAGFGRRRRVTGRRRVQHRVRRTAGPRLDSLAATQPGSSLSPATHPAGGASSCVW